MQLAAQGVHHIGIDYKDSDADAQRWLARHGNPYRTVVTDPHGAVGLDWGVYGAPETYVLNAAGIIVHKQIGPIDETVWRARIAPLMKAKRPEARSVGNECVSMCRSWWRPNNINK